MRGKSLRGFYIILLTAGIGLICGLLLKQHFFGSVVRLPLEVPAAVAPVVEAGQNRWIIPMEALGGSDGESGRYVLRLDRLRAKRVDVSPAGFWGESLVVESGALAPGDLVIIHPAPMMEGAAIAVTSGIDEKKLLELTIEAGIAAAQENNLIESARFISPDYRDSLGFDFRFMAKMLERAYKEFDSPRVERVEPPDIRIEENGIALVRESIRVEAGFKGRRSYLLGGPGASNTLVARMEKRAGGWKLAEISGLMPLGFDEKFMRLIGAEVGLPLSAAEKDEKKAFCMPCRGKMADRFGGGK